MFISAFITCVVALGGETPAAAEDGTFSIVLDAGHGGMDGGVCGRETGVTERDINLAVTLKLKDVLEDRGFKITLTRKTDSGLYDAATKGFKKRDMQKRKEIVEKANPDLLISVHQNYYPSTVTRGAQVFYAIGSEKGKAFATGLQASLNKLYETQKVKNRVATAGDYFMLKCAPCPSVIVECGFLSSPADEKLLTSEAWQKKIAEAVASGVTAYLENN